MGRVLVVGSTSREAKDLQEWWVNYALALSSGALGSEWRFAGEKHYPLQQVNVRLNIYRL